MKLKIEKRTITEFAETETQIVDNDKTFDQMYETWQILDIFFAQNNYEKDLNWRLTYFRIYVRLTWKMIGTIIDYNKFIEIIRRQIPMALILDVDVLREMMWYFGFSKSDKNKLVSLYLKIKNTFFESEQIVGIWQGKNIMVKDLVSEYLLLEKRDASSMEEAEFISKLKQIMCPKEVAPFVYADKDVSVDRFLELVEFFEEVDGEKIWFVVDIFLNPEKYQRSETDSSVPTSESDEEVEDNKTEGESFSGNEQTVIVESQKSLTAEQTPIVDSQKRLTTGQVKSQIESEFKKDSEGNFEDIEGVMGKLAELAEENNDPSVAEMIYFDEEENKFKWKE